MALQGTLDTFSLIDVLRLLAASDKTGRLQVHAEVGAGALWLDSGKVVGGELDGLALDAVAVAAQLLRQAEGTFVFVPDEPAPAPGQALELEALLTDAEDLLAAWRELEAVVPSVDAWVRLAPELPGDEVVVDRSSWTVLVASGAGVTVAELAALLGVSELEACRRVKDLVEAGLLEVLVDDALEDEPAWDAEEAPPAPVAAVADEPTPFDDEPARSDEPVSFGESLSFGEPVPYDGVVPFDELDDPFVELPAPAPEVAAAWARDLGSVDEPATATEPTDLLASTEPGDPIDTIAAADESIAADGSASLGIVIPGFDSIVSYGAAVARAAGAPELDEDGAGAHDPSDGIPDGPVELPNLTPQAARALAAAAQARTDAERDAALADAVDDDNEPIDRNLLLRFLSSVKQ